MATPATMRQLEERQVEREIRLLLWSPKMDILAVASAEGDVSLYRLNWQRIWIVEPPEGATCESLVWRPDGKVLAAGYNTGEIALLDVENNEPVHRNNLTGAITCMAWPSCESAEEKSRHHGFDDPCSPETWAFLTKFPSLSKAYSYNPSGPEEMEDCQRLRDDGSVSLLICGTSKGQVTLFMNGFLKCAMIDLNLVTSVNCVICDVIVAPHQLTTFSVISTFSRDEEEEEQIVQVSAFNMPLISTCFEELSALSRKYSVLEGTLSYMSDTLMQISEAWESILLEMDTKLASYSSQMPDECGMAADFLELLMLGTASAELEYFLLQDLAEKGLKKLGHSIEVSYSNVQRLVLKYLHTVSQALNFHTAEMVGLCRASDKFGVLGVTEEAIIDAQRKAATFWSKGIELQQVIDESMKSFKAFFRWLYVEILRLSNERVSEDLSRVSQQDIRFIADFLSSFAVEEQQQKKTTGGGGENFSHMYLEKVGQYLKSEPLTQPVDRSKNPWHTFLEQNPDFAQEVPFIMKVSENTSLMQEYESLRGAVNNIFESMDCHMTDKCQHLGDIRIPFKGPRGPKCMQLDCAGGTCEKVYGIVSQAHHGGGQILDNKLFFYELNSAAKSMSNNSVRGMWLTFDQAPSADEDGMNLVDCEFYTSDTVSLLLSNATGSDNQRVILLPIAHLEPYLSPLAISAFKPSLLSHASSQLNSKSVFQLAGQACHRELEHLSASMFAVSGPRKVAAFLFKNRKRIRIYDMEVEEEDDDEENETVDNSGFSSDPNSSM